MIQKYLLYWLTLLVLFTAMPVMGQSFPPQAGSFKQKAKAIERLAQRYHKLQRFSGSILIAAGDSIIFRQHYGLANYEDNLAFNEHSAFKIGTLSELFTAAIIRRLEKEGKIDVQQPASTYLPSLLANYTINDLLQHRSGLPGLGHLRDSFPALEYSATAYANRALANGLQTDWSELDYNLLGEIAERVSGKSFEQLLARLSDDYQLSNSFYQQSPGGGKVQGYISTQGQKRQRSPSYHEQQAFASSGIKASIDDVFKLSRSRDSMVEVGYLATDGFSYALKKGQFNDYTILILSNYRHPVAGEMAESILALLQNAPYRLPLKREIIALDTAALTAYAGIYRSDDGMEVEIVPRGGKLKAIMGPYEVSLLPQAIDQFFLADSDAALRFHRNETGQVTAVELLDGFLKGPLLSRAQVK